MNNLAQRVVTAVVLIAVLLALLFKVSSTVFIGALFVFGGLAVWELWRLVQKDNARALFVMLMVYCACALQFWTAQWIFVLWGLGAVHFAVTVWVLWKKPRLARLSTGVYGAVLLACVMYAITVLQGFGAWVLITSMLVVWATDVGGYFFGKGLGGKFINLGLAPSISPKKSWEGAIGGVLLVALVSMFLIYLQFEHHVRSWNPLAHKNVDEIWQQPVFAVLNLVLAMAVAAYSVTGDLVESLLKRQAGVKDSSQLLPGHGGILDRIDALIPVLPLCAAWAAVVGYP